MPRITPPAVRPTKTVFRPGSFFTITRKRAGLIFAGETAAVLLNDLIVSLTKKDEPVFFLLAAFIIPGYLLTALLVRAFAAAQARSR